MREVEFRGKCLDNGEWKHGYYYAEYPYQCIISDEERKKQEKHWIVWQENMDWGLTRMVRAQVDPETVGQYTGFKNIYEGDICDTHTKWGKGMVVYEDGMFKLCGMSLVTFMPKVKKIGNIHDNPELINER